MSKFHGFWRIARKERAGITFGVAMAAIGAVFFNPVVVYAGGAIAALYVLRNVL